MARSFDLVDEKVFEADFFLEKLRNAGLNFFEARCYFNAFISATRTITYALQAVMKDIDGFQEWYKAKQNELKQDELARFFHNARNESQHIGLNFVNSGETFMRDGQLITRYYFTYLLDNNAQTVPSSDVVTTCEKYLIQLVDLIFECYSTFGNIIDPDQYYTVENIDELGLTIEEIEEELGFPKGWTNIGNTDASTRLNAIRQSVPGSEIDIIFQKYLNKNRKHRR